MEIMEDLSVLLATTPATTQAGLVAQIERFREHLVDYPLGNASPAHDTIFETLSKSRMNIAA